MRASIKLSILALVAVFMVTGCVTEGVSIKADKIDTNLGSTEGLDIQVDKVDTN